MLTPARYLISPVPEGLPASQTTDLNAHRKIHLIPHFWLSLAQSQLLPKIAFSSIILQATNTIHEA